jgi:hypothetical protein
MGLSIEDFRHLARFLEGFFYGKISILQPSRLSAKVAV